MGRSRLRGYTVAVDRDAETGDAQSGARLGERPDFKHWMNDVAAAVEARRGHRTRKPGLLRRLARLVPALLGARR